MKESLIIHCRGYFMNTYGINTCNIIFHNIFLNTYKQTMHLVYSCSNQFKYWLLGNMTKLQVVPKHSFMLDAFSDKPH